MADHALLTAEDHRELRVRTDRAAALGDDLMYAPVMPDEFRRVQEDYPILFRRTAEQDGFVAVALFGFEAGENLFLGDGGWDAGYVPLALDIQPFLIGRTQPGSDAPKQVHVDLASRRIAAEGVRVFDEHGRPTPFLETIAEKLGALDAGHAGQADFFAALQRHALLEPLTLDVTLDDGSRNSLVGFHAIDEERLRELSAEELGALHAEEHLLPIFMAVASIGRFGALIARKNRTLRRG